MFRIGPAQNTYTNKIGTHASENTEKVKREQADARKKLEDYLTVQNGTFFGESKQEVLNAVRRLRLTSEQARQIRNDVKNPALRRSAGDDNDIALVIFVLRKLKDDHHSRATLKLKSSMAYKALKKGLRNQADNVCPDVSADGPLLTRKHRYFYLAPGSKPSRKAIVQAIEARADISHLDFRGQNLREVDLSRTDLEGVNLKDTQLDAAGLQHAINCGADVSGVDLRGQDLREIDWKVAVLAGAKLWRARVNGKDLAYLAAVGVDLLGVDLREQDLRDVNPRDANLKNAVLANSKMDKAFFERAIWAGADVRGVDLSEQDLEGLVVPHGRMIDLKEANLHNTVMCGLDLRQTHINFEHAYMEGTNLSGTKLSPQVFEQLVRAGANLNGVDLSGQEIPYFELPFTFHRIINMGSANLTGALLQGNWLRLVNFKNAKIDDRTDILLTFYRDFDINFNHINNPWSLLAAINSIDNIHAHLKRTLMTQVVERIGENAGRAIVPSIGILLNGSFDYTNTIRGDEKFFDSFLTGVIDRGNKLALPLNDNDLRLLVIHHLAKMKPDALDDFMFKNNNYFIQVMHQGRISTDTEISRECDFLYKNYLTKKNLPEINELVDIIEPENNYLIFTKETFSLAVSPKYIDKFLYRRHPEIKLSWNNEMAFFNRGFCLAVNDIERDVFSHFSLFHKEYAYQKKQAKLTQLLDLLELGSYRQFFDLATEKRRSGHNLCAEVDRKNLDAHFQKVYTLKGVDKLYGADAMRFVSLDPHHVSAICDIYQMDPTDKKQQASLLLLLGGIFSNFSSSRHFGTPADSPDALRKYAYGLVSAAHHMDPNLIGEPRFKGWAKRFFGLGTEIECSGAVYEDILRFCQTLPDFEKDFAGVVPLAWE